MFPHLEYMRSPREESYASNRTVVKLYHGNSGRRNIIKANSLDAVGPLARVTLRVFFEAASAFRKYHSENVHGVTGRIRKPRRESVDPPVRNRRGIDAWVDARFRGE